MIGNFSIERELRTARSLMRTCPASPADRDPLKTT
jgi:hypothetical protein